VIDLDIGLTDDMRAVRETCHRFAVEVLRPVGARLDRMSAAEVIAPASPLWDTIRKFKALGFGGGASLVLEDATPAQNALLHCIMLEELCWGDVGLFITCGLSNMTGGFARSLGRADLAEFFDARDEIGCLAVTEPMHGSDHIAFTEAAYRDPSLRPGLRVRREGADFILSGQKSAWVSCGTIAGSGAVFGVFEDSRAGFADGAAFLMPFDLPGITRGKPLEKLGQRTLNQGEIFFDAVRVPRKFLIAEGPDAYPFVWEAIIKGANMHMGAQLIGVARAAYDLALEHAKTWKQGGRPIIEHQLVKHRLFQMFQKVEVARSHVRRLCMADAMTPGGLPFQYAASSKVFVTQTAFEVASEALQIFGGNGLTREYPIEKLVRDARSSLIEDGENYVLGLMAAARL